MLGRDQILGAKDLVTEEVEVPEWGGSVLVRALSGSELDEFEGENYDVANGQVVMNKRNARARLLSRAICNDKGEALFTKKDVDALGKKSSRALNRVVVVAEQLNGIDKRALGRATKNSERGLVDDSISD